MVTVPPRFTLGAGVGVGAAGAAGLVGAAVGAAAAGFVAAGAAVGAAVAAGLVGAVVGAAGAQATSNTATATNDTILNRNIILSSPIEILVVYL
jgi:hypothetical protein